MTQRIWDSFLTERDRLVFAASGYGALQGFGQRPALLVIDVNYFFCGDRPEPILESIKRWRNSCGEDAWPAIKVIRRLIDTAREKGVPVIYTTGTARPDLWNRGSWLWTNSRAGEDTAVVALSDHGHGMRPVKLLNVNEVLRRGGFLVPKGSGMKSSPLDNTEALKRWSVGFVNRFGIGGLSLRVLHRFPSWKRVFASPKFIDYGRTRAYVSDLSAIKCYSY